MMMFKTLQPKQKQKQQQQQQYLTNDFFMKTFAFVSIAVAIQLLHMLEHVSQVIQTFIQNSPSAHGLLGQSVAIEPLHFIYNISYLGLLALVWLRFRNNTAMRKTMKLAYGLVTFVLVFQSWHFVEHTVKLEQHFIDGCITCPGILGHSISLPILHFAYNLIVLIPLVVVFYLITDAKIILKNE
jgi:hypothetical protein